MAVQGSQKGVAAVVQSNLGTYLYFYGECKAEYCGISLESGSWQSIKTSLSADMLNNVAEIDLNANELVLRFMDGSVAVSNPHGLCGLAAWTPTKRVQGFFSTNLLGDGYRGYVLEDESLRACDSGNAKICEKRCLSAASDGRRALYVSGESGDYSVKIVDLKNV